jgi:DNA-directed RNA polymerase subunit beta
LPTRTRDRYSFANIEEALSLPDLIAIQRESFDWFVENGLKDTFADISPIRDFTETLQLELEFDPNDEDLRPPPKFSVEECKEKDMTFSAPIFVRARFINATTGEIKEQTVFMGDFPMMTEKGTFVINGTERVVVSQLVRSPGVIFEPGERFRLRNLTKHQLVKGTIHPYRGEWMEFDVEQKPGKDVTAGTRVARKRPPRHLHAAARPRLRRGGRPGFLDRFVDHFDFLQGQWDKERDLAPTQDEALVEIYKRARPGRAADGRVGQGLLPQRLLREPPLRPLAGRPLQAQPQARLRGCRARRAVRPHRRPARPARARTRTSSAAARCWRRSPTCSTSSSRSPATASTTRTTSPTGASARSAS